MRFGTELSRIVHTLTNTPHTYTCTHPHTCARTCSKRGTCDKRGTKEGPSEDSEVIKCDVDGVDQQAEV